MVLLAMTKIVQQQKVGTTLNGGISFTFELVN